MTAETNIPIFKIVLFGSFSKKIISPYFDFRYELNTKYTNLQLLVERCFDSYFYPIWKVSAGFHSYSAECKVSEDMIVSLLDGNIHRYDYHVFSCRANGYIPAGAQYLLNEKGEYVSTEIVLTEIIE